MRDLLAERGITVDSATVYRWVQKFGPEIRKRAHGAHRSWRGQLIDFRLTAAKNTLKGIETHRAIKKGHFATNEPGILNETAFVANLFDTAA